MATTDRRAEVTLPGDREILVTREFDAPRHLVYAHDGVRFGSHRETRGQPHA
jgi:hypothetical protein